LQELSVTAEPRAGMDAVAIVRPGALVELLGSSVGEYVRVDASGRSGYVAAGTVAVIE
jgi:SH3-like domain-containing protein